ncbi:RFX DNA-binding domain-containing protein [Durotheca rogersii]|uniref:RFX DNA-binding domain-containing protein n=1 Tax=Durotheca rogersii TaxID=419775 RepID=UPI00221E5191|nr:RFX DNA-binding domain-containing protein [Durotheca rogersii]KAI5867284.1 RFX DNA-binding domain-containing protein [Durotheca rogersii]
METNPQPLDAGAMSQHHRPLNPRKRALSRGSTASIHSVATQPTIDQPSLMPHHPGFADQWVPNDHSQPRDPSAVQPMPASDMMLRPASQMHAAQSFPVDSSMHSTAGSTMAYHQHPALHHGLPPETFGTNASFTDADSQIMDRDNLDEGEPLAGPMPASKPSSSRASANNELEMRQLFHANKHRYLGDVAKELHGNERGPNSERARQIFAMLWINQVCSAGKGSVPRSRVYANYASRCATERITVLNPASFGKLVRVLFRDLKTRRLGIRGESKYHYVDFTLIEEQPELPGEPASQPTLPFPEPMTFTQTFSAAPSQSPALNGQNSTLASPTLRQHPDAQSISQKSHYGIVSVYNQPDVTSMDQLNSSKAKTTLRLAFVDEADESFQQSQALILPSIDPFLPDGTDPDAAKSLTALYRSHCTSLVECIRYCKERAFFHLFTSFQGTLTMPVQKLFSNPSIAPWIEECDFVLYKRMMQILSNLTLQVVPTTVLDTLRNISERLVAHIRQSFNGQPGHLLKAKEGPATIFANLLDRILRVNLTAHAAANMLSNPANRDLMYLDWITKVRIRKISECVPARGMDDVVDLLLTEIRALINPANVPWDLECLTLYGELAGSPPAAESREVDKRTVLDGWVAFLRSLPGRFPYASPADIVVCVQRVGMEVMRDLTIAGSKSFSSWWVTKVFVDEMIVFLAELGGLIKAKRSSSAAAASVPKPAAADTDANHRGSHLSGRSNSGSSDDIDMPRVSQPQPDRALFPSQADANNQDPIHMSTNHDDSGIGIRTPEEDFPVDKYDFQPGHGQSLQSLGLDHELQ